MSQESLSKTSVSDNFKTETITLKVYLTAYPKPLSYFIPLNFPPTTPPPSPITMNNTNFISNYPPRHTYSDPPGPDVIYVLHCYSTTIVRTPNGWQPQDLNHDTAQSFYYVDKQSANPACNRMAVEFAENAGNLEHLSRIPNGDLSAWIYTRSHDDGSGTGVQTTFYVTPVQKGLQSRPGPWSQVAR